jgi:hypothetical protein
MLSQEAMEQARKTGDGHTAPQRQSRSVGEHVEFCKAISKQCLCKKQMVSVTQG